MVTLGQTLLVFGLVTILFDLRSTGRAHPADMWNVACVRGRDSSAEGLVQGLVQGLVRVTGSTVLIDTASGKQYGATGRDSVALPDHEKTSSPIMRIGA